MGIFTSLERSAGDSRLAKDWRKLHDYGRDTLVPQGDKLTSEGLGGLRDLNRTYQGRMNDPLGEIGRGIFSRARGAINDDAIRGNRSFAARLNQRALQSGGVMSPEAIAELEQQNQRDINESRFQAQAGVSDAEAQLTLSETGKLFDRMEGIQRTITGVGQDEKTRGLQAIIAALTGRHNRMAAIASTVAGVWSSGNQQWGQK